MSEKEKKTSFEMKQWQLGFALFAVLVLLFGAIVFFVPGGFSVLTQAGLLFKFIFLDVGATGLVFLALIALPMVLSIYARVGINAADEKVEYGNEFPTLVHWGLCLMVSGLIGLIWVVIVPVAVNLPFLQLKYIWENMFSVSTVFEALPVWWGIWAFFLSILGYWGKNIKGSMF
jgi:hypothetical protein